MQDFIEFAFADGTSVLVEIEPTPHVNAPNDLQSQMPNGSTVGPVGLGSRAVQRAGTALRDVFAPVVPIMGSMHDEVSRMSPAPDTLSVSFGVKLTAGLQLAVVSGGEASFTVSATWKLPRETSTPVPEPDIASAPAG